VGGQKIKRNIQIGGKPMSLIEIRPPASFSEYQQACSLVETVYSEHGIAAKHRLAHPTANFVAVQDGLVIGSIGFRSAAQGTLPAEHYFGFDAAKACSAPRTEVCEIVKLAAKERADFTVFRGLIAACLQYGFVEREFSAALAITKPKLERALNRLLHIPTWAPACRIVSERAMAENPRYFFEDGCPRPICVERNDCPLYLPSLLGQLKGRATLDTQTFDHSRDYSLANSYPERRRQIMTQPVPTEHVMLRFVSDSLPCAA
jgi:hypothetical protein